MKTKADTLLPGFKREIEMILFWKERQHLVVQKMEVLSHGTPCPCWHRQPTTVPTHTTYYAYTSKLTTTKNIYAKHVLKIKEISLNKESSFNKLPGQIPYPSYQTFEDFSIT